MYRPNVKNGSVALPKVTWPKSYRETLYPVAPASTVCVDGRRALIGFLSPAVDVSFRKSDRKPLVQVPGTAVGVAVVFSVLNPANVPSVAGALVGTRTTSSKSKGKVRLLLLSGLRVNPNGLKFAFLLVNVIPLEPHPLYGECEPVVVPQKPCSVIGVVVVVARAGEAVTARVKAPIVAAPARTEEDLILCI